MANKKQKKGFDQQDKKGSDPASQNALSRKEYEKELARLHVELVKLQEWVVKTGAKVCIVFEGRDGAGKGGTIKAITERVSPRVFRVVALAAPTEREKSQMYMQRYFPHLPAAGEVVIFDRSWYNRAGVEASHGVLHRSADRPLPERRSATGTGNGRFRHSAVQVLAGSQRRRADPQAASAHQRRAENLEAHQDGS